jgi:hypothetical protein
MNLYSNTPFWNMLLWKILNLLITLNSFWNINGSNTTFWNTVCRIDVNASYTPWKALDWNTFPWNIALFNELKSYLS